MKNILYAFLLISSSFFVLSCESNEDKDPPTIEIFEPKENQEYKIGEAIKMRFRFTDGYGVRYYSYEFFHEDGVVPGEFDYKQAVEINGPVNDFQVNPSINIPTKNKNEVPTATGRYILRVIALDWHSNRSYQDLPIVINPKETTN